MYLLIGSSFKIFPKYDTISLILPIIVLTIILGTIGMIIKNALLIFFAVTNLLGAAGDIMMTLLVIKLPKEIKYSDYNSDIGAYFISKEDISNKKVFGLKCVETGDHSLKKIDDTIKRFSMTKGSIIYIIIFYHFWNKCVNE